MGRRRGGKGSSSSAAAPAPVSEDEIEKFHNQKDAIMFDEEDADLEGEEYEAIMDLPSEEDSDEGDDYDEEADTKWGRNKKSYYSADTRAVDEEAQEARKIQQRKLQSMKTSHFIPETANTMLGTRKNSKKNGTVEPVVLSASEDDESDDNDDEKDDFKKFLLQEPTQLIKDLIKSDGFQALDEAQKLKLLEENSAPFASFLADFRSKFEQAHEQLQPLLERLSRDPKSPGSTREGLGFLKAKCQLLLAYCTNVAFYCGLRLAGKPVDKHPVVERMVRFRLLLEKMKPLEKKLKGQIDKLLQAKSTNGESIADPLLHKPNPELLLSSSMEEENAAGSDDEDRAYRAPKLAPMHYPEDKAEKVDRQRERQRRMESQSQLLRELRADIEDAPEEEAIDVVYGSRKDRRGTQKVAERDAYEEENLVRFTLTKRDKRALKESEGKPVDELAALDDFFGELDRFHGGSADASAGGALGKILGLKNGKRKDVGGEEKKAKLPKRQFSDDDDSIDSDLSEIEDDLDLYESVKQSHDSRKAAKSHKPASKANYRNLQDMADGETKRPASWKILKNKGLTPSRPKEVRNPRVHRRVKYERAMKRIGSFKPVAGSKSGPYGGESSGIRTNISKSVKF